MIRIAIVEDEKQYADELAGFILDFSKETGVAVEYETFGDGASFIDEYDSRFDIVLMDIAMPHLNGMDAAKLLRQNDKQVCLIFITTLSNYAIKGYEVDAFDFGFESQWRDWNAIVHADPRLTVGENTAFDNYPMRYHSMGNWHLALYNFLLKIF